MISFISRIRRHLLAANKLQKYLFYALGEIVLVVLGILIALQINNWVEKNKLAQKEKIILGDIKKDLEANMDLLKTDLKRSHETIEKMDYILDFLKGRTNYNDSLGQLISSLHWMHNMTTLGSSFESLKSMGFEIIRDNELRLEIIRLFDRELPEISYWINIGSLEKHREFRSILMELPVISIDTAEEIRTNQKLAYLVRTFRGWLEEKSNRIDLVLQNTEILFDQISVILTN